MRWAFMAAAAMTVASAVPMASAHPLEKGLVISDPKVIEALEARHGYGFKHFMSRLIHEKTPCPWQPPRGNDDPATSKNPFEYAPLCDVATTLRDHIDKKWQASLDPIARATGAAFRFRTDFFHDNDATLTLVGIVNRMDRAHVARNPAETCGEIRLIYRFGYAEKDVASRLPLTMNLVLRARRAGQAETCADIARSWLAFAAAQPDDFVRTADEARQVATALAKGGPLSLLSPAHVDRMEFNVQTMRVSASAKEDFGTHAEYLLKVFEWVPGQKKFVSKRLENQVDPDLRVEVAYGPDGKRTPAFKAALARLKAVLFSEAGLAALDRGELLIGREFLADSAISVAPGGEARSQNSPFNKLIGSEQECSTANAAERAGFICPQEFEEAIRHYEQKRGKLKNVRSVEGFRTRLGDISCTGCHQTRGVAGFHFPGADRPAPGLFAANAVLVPASAHFFGDLPRRRAILEAMAATGGNTAAVRRVDFSRGFSARPESRFADALRDTAIMDGWGAVCHDRETPESESDKSARLDPSFVDWTCRAGLRCEVITKSPRHSRRGMCTTDGTRAVGDPLERGIVGVSRHATTREPPAVSTATFGNDGYVRVHPNATAAYRHRDTSINIDALKAQHGRDDYRAAQQQWYYKTLTGGFPGGNLRTQCCVNLPAGATCGMVAENGFSECLRRSVPPRDGVSFNDCFKAPYVNYAGLRACDIGNPCREDYICLRSIVDPADPERAYGQLPETLVTYEVADSSGRLDTSTELYRCSRPDQAWLAREMAHPQGTCLPPYFVFQFRADKHEAHIGVVGSTK